MTAVEFKAWFAGFCSALDGCPTPDQWALIRAKVDEIEPPVPAAPYIAPVWPVSPSPSLVPPTIPQPWVTWSGDTASWCGNGTVVSVS